MKREWNRLILSQGWLPLGLLIAVALALILGFDALLKENDRLGEELARKEATLVAAKARREVLDNIEKTLASSRASVSAINARMVSAGDDPNGAGERMSQALKAAYTAAGVKQAAVTAGSAREAGGITYLSGVVDAPMPIEQFAALLRNKNSAPLALRLVDASIEANDATTPTGLRTRMTWEAIRAPYVPPPVDPKAAKTAAKKTTATPRVTERNAKRTDTPTLGEEKRK